MGSTLLWAIKNGDLDAVKEHVDKDKKVGILRGCLDPLCRIPILLTARQVQLEVL